MKLTLSETLKTDFLATRPILYTEHTSFITTILMFIQKITHLSLSLNLVHITTRIDHYHINAIHITYFIDDYHCNVKHITYLFDHYHCNNTQRTKFIDHYHVDAIFFDFLLSVKVAPHECAIITGQP